MSFYGSIYNTPRDVMTYGAARRIYDKTTPIKGTTTRPFGARRDHHKYSIDLSPTNGDVFVYVERNWTKEPLLTYHQDDTITVRALKHSPTLSHHLISWLLRIETDGRMNRTNLHFTNAEGKMSYALNTGETLRLRRNPEMVGRWEVLTIKEYHDWRIDRQGANNVRARYKGFADYLKAFVSLRTESTGRHGDIVMINISEYVEHFPERVESLMMGTNNAHRKSLAYHRSREDVNLRLATHPTATEAISLPPSEQLRRKDHKHYAEVAGELLLLCSTNDHIKWYKAALWVCAAAARSGHWYDTRHAIAPESVHIAKASMPTKFFDDFILMFNSNETLKLVKLPAGKVPTNKYKEWVNTSVGGD